MKNTFILLLAVVLGIEIANAQVSINTDGSEANASAMLDVVSTSKGMLAPRMTTAQREAIPSPANGLLVFDTSTGSFWYFESNVNDWLELTSILGGTVTDIDGLSDAKTTATSIYLGLNSGNSDAAHRNTAVGINSLDLANGTENTAIGYGSQSSLTSGYENTSIGYRALSAIQTGYRNTAVGYLAGGAGSISSKSGNVYLGYMAGYNSIGDNKLFIDNSQTLAPLIGGDFDTDEVYINGTIKITGGSPGNGKVLTSDAIGNASWQNAASPNYAIDDLSDAISNESSVFLGFKSGISDDGSVNENTSLGAYSMKNTSTGAGNTALGYEALSNNTTGSNNVAIGYNAGPAAAAYSNTISIGFNASAAASDRVVIGDNNMIKIGGYAPWTDLSDKRFKKDITPNVTGLDFIMRLNPVTYHLDISKLDHFKGKKEEDIDQQSRSRKESIIYSGFIAQEVEKAAEETGYNFSGVYKPENSKDHYSLAYSTFVVPLVKAVQEQQTQIEQQQQTIEQMQKELVDLKKLIKK